MIQATVKLYDEQPYAQEFDAAVLAAEPGKDPGTVRLALDATLFFPEEGGQTPDRGLLAGYHVLDVQLEAGDVIWHLIQTEENVGEGTEQAQGSADDAAAQLLPGQRVHGVLDWRHRYSNMQNHSGEHVLSGLLHSQWGYENVGFRLSENTVTLDTGGMLQESDVRRLEQMANEVIWRNVGVFCTYPSREELAGLEYRSKKEIDGPVRIVEIEGVDICACCAPHVRRTGEIGMIKILSAEKNQDAFRLTFVCGERALHRMQQYQDQLREASRLMNEPRETVADGVKRLKEELARAHEICRGRELQYVDARIRQLEAELGGVLDEAGEGAARSCAQAEGRDRFLFEGDLSVPAQRELMNRMCSMGWRYAGVLVGSDETGWKYLIGSRGQDARILNQMLRETFGAKGGGKPEMVQGTVMASRADVEEALRGSE